MRRKVILLVVTVVVIVGSFIFTLFSDSRPVLGLDLQGGTSIVLAPVKGSDLSTLDAAVSIIRNRVDGLGIAEPNVSRQGNNIVIDLPGVKNAEEANALVGKTAELRFRPVIATIPYSSSAATTTTVKGATTTTVKGATTTTVKGATTTTVPATTSDRGHLHTRPRRSVRPPQRSRAPRPPPSSRRTTAPARTGNSSPSRTLADQQVILPDTKNAVCFVLGPTILTGRNVGTADAIVNPSTAAWEVNVHFKNNDFVEKVATPYVGKQVAIELDGVVQSAPNINAGITGQNVTISGSFTSKEAQEPRAGAPLRIAAGATRRADRADRVADARQGPTAGRNRLRTHRSRPRRALHDPASTDSSDSSCGSGSG